MRPDALSTSLALRQAVIRTSAVIESDQKRISFYFPADPDTIDAGPGENFLRIASETRNRVRRTRSTEVSIARSNSSAPNRTVSVES